MQVRMLANYKGLYRNCTYNGDGYEYPVFYKGRMLFGVKVLKSLLKKTVIVVVPLEIVEIINSEV